MRLIDADTIDFGKVFIGTSDFAKDTREAAQELIDSQPTAFDLESVIEQLGKRKGYLLNEFLLSEKDLSVKHTVDARINEIDGIIEIIKSNINKEYEE